MKKTNACIATVKTISLAFLLAACSTISPHENFKSAMQSNVGKRADNPFSEISRYPQWVKGSHELSNGNIETKFLWRKHCPVFFEIDPVTQIIVGWRFEGSERDCQIVP